jgi:hypothetical protein
LLLLRKYLVTSLHLMDLRLDSHNGLTFFISSLQTVYDAAILGIAITL